MSRFIRKPVVSKPPPAPVPPPEPTATIELTSSVAIGLLGARQTLSFAGQVNAVSELEELMVTADGEVLARTRFVSASSRHGFAFLLSRPLIESGEDWTITLQGRLRDATTHSESYLLTVSGGRGQVQTGPVLPIGATAPPAAILLHPEEISLDQPDRLFVRGWVLAQSPVTSLTIGDDAGKATLGLLRNDVATSFPDYPDADRAGFELTADLPSDARPGAFLLRATTATGAMQELAITLDAPDAEEQTAGEAERPLDPRRQVRVFCDEAIRRIDGMLFVTGWAISGLGIQDVSVWIGDQCLGPAEFGLPRHDVGDAHPLIPMARFSGYRAVLPAPEDLSSGSLVRVIARNGLGDEAATEHAVTLAPRPADTPQRPAPTEAPKLLRLEIDSPSLSDSVAQEQIGNRLTIDGWALSDAGVAEIEVLLNGQLIGQAHHGIVRQDVARAFPGREDALRSGFAFHTPPRLLREGAHTVELRLTTRDGGSVKRSFGFQVRAPEEASPGRRIRTQITQAEADFYAAALRRHEARARFAVWLADRDAAQDADVAATLNSLRSQIYRDWRAIPATADPLADLEDNEFLCILYPGDLLGDDAFAEIALAGALSPDAELFYADELRSPPGGSGLEPFHKPGFSPSLLLATNYIGRPWVASGSLLRRAGVTSLGQPHYDVLLRCVEQANAVRHIPRLLLQRGLAPPDPEDAERKSLADAALRRGLSAEVTPGLVPGIYYLQPTTPVSGKVSVIIPTCAAQEQIAACIGALRATTRGREVEVICIENIPPEQEQWRGWLHANADRVISTAEPFNWSRFNNLAAAQATGDFLLFLNDDVIAEQDGWLERMLSRAVQPAIGVVGARLLYPNRTVQHAGMFLAPGCIGRHAFRFAGEHEPGYFGLTLTERDVSAVTGACMLMRREHFESLGGFDEAHEIVNNDLDFCLRTIEAGRQVVYTPHATLIHHELASRAGMPDRYGLGAFRSRWGSRFAEGDPFHNPNLSLYHDDIQVNDERTVTIHGGHPRFDPATIRQILVVKLDHLGDVITAFPAIRRLKDSFPQATIRMLAGPVAQAFAGLEPAIAEIIPFEFFHARSALGQKKLTPEDFGNLRQRLSPFGFDLAIDLRKHIETRAVLRATGARLLAGFDQAGQFPWLDIALEWEGDRALHPKRSHIADDLMNLVQAVVTAGQRGRGGLPPETIAALQDASPPPDALRNFFRRPVVCLHPGAGNAMKQWPEENFTALADLLVRRCGANVLLIGGPDEAASAERIAMDAQDEVAVRSVAGIIPLRMLPALISRCTLFVGNDSGPKHIAALIGIPTIGIHSGTVDPTEWAPLGPDAVAVSRAMTCSPCYLNRLSDCSRGLACIRQIEPATIFDLCRRLLPS